VGGYGQPYKSFLCFDVEATCEAGRTFEYPNEIIVSLEIILQSGVACSRWLV
jgi:3'-5' exoribonuclease 1